MSKFTLVTGLWDLGRDKLQDFGRPFSHYLDKFNELLTLDFNMVIYIPKELDDVVKFHKNRNSTNTVIIHKELHEFQDYCPWYKDIQELRVQPEWQNNASWLPNSPQASLEYYNPIVMSKFFMLNDAAIINHFGSQYLFWIDAGLVNTVCLDTLRNMDRLSTYMSDKKFVFLSFPYRSDTEVHGYLANVFDGMCGEESRYVCRGGFFGGHRKTINQLNGDYYGIADESFRKGVMGTEECFHTIMSYRRKDISRYELEDDGLVFRFFEEIGKLPPLAVQNVSYDRKKHWDEIKTSLYVLTYNSPSQFRTLLETYWLSDPDFINCPRKILIDNSTDPETYAHYSEICKEWDFEHIKKRENVGICGGRQFAAEHFDESDSEYYIFLEDDMNLHEGMQGLYRKSLSIIHRERYDYLKLSFKEFYGDNETQWAWYNVPQTVRDEFFPDNATLPENGLSDNAPKIEPTARKRYKDLHYLEGDFYYCNWPLWFNKAGNQKVFIDTKWAHPYEQTWMSHAFQLQKRGIIRSGCLNLSPINHVRFDFYPAEERKES